MSRVAVVTGAARGIGAATVHLLVAEGWKVVAVDACANDPALSYPLATVEDLESLGRHTDAVVALRGDVRERGDLEHAVAVALERFGRIDAGVACAGVINGGSALWEQHDAAYAALMEVNVGGVRHLAQAVIPPLLAAPEPRQGRFVAVASAAGTLGLPRLAAYSASKHAVIGLVKGLAADLDGTGITANSVCPGSTRTTLLDESARIYGLASPEDFAAQQLLGRLLEPTEPAALIAWLCGESSSGVTGAALAVDGGLTTR
jgi:SDR family mycofactocin-dependent oxidoreductase